MPVTFSAQVKQELCRQSMSRRCCAQAEAYGILLYCNTFHAHQVRIITESPQLKQRLPLLFHKAFRLEFDVIPPMGEGKGSFLLEDPAKLRTIFDTFGLERDSAVSLHINFAHLEEEHCQTAFFRGAFLAGGSVTDPGKSYHLELATSHAAVGRESIALLQEVGFTPKDTQRKGNHVTYFKQSDHIEDFLTTIGAPVSAMEVMTAKLERDLRGSVNRRVNCDAANLDKTVEAARWQMEAIYRLEERGMLENLPDKLKEAVDLRMAHPELTLAQLAELCTPPVSKSALNHRLRKLAQLAES
ncbi:DNA-binding protein WhiA [Pseudoflavonifractor capillosus]|uniref:DNA-binding protein WhiA n=1 Tax=Pseudoflavonifractor capillosus TaxID=106588 RepID=UPI001A9C61F1|nr:DNA-binding protein WhiA [Pseudoflavonifractor capillosus]